MRETILGRIQKDLFSYSKVITNVLNIDIEIVDNHLVRLAGTGIYEDVINKKVKGKVYQEVMDTVEEKIIYEPKKHAICARCDEIDKCEETMEIAVPIMIEDKIIGVIGLVCSTKKQKEYLMENINNHLDFIRQMGDLISQKAYVNEENKTNISLVNLFKQITNSVKSGILVLNNKMEVISYNNISKDSLKIEEAGKPCKIEETEEYIIDSKIYKITIGKRSIMVGGEFINVKFKFSDYNKIFIFNPIKQIKSDMYKLTDNTRRIGIDSILGNSKQMCDLKDTIKKVANTKSTVLVVGESGTGKELIARAIHAESNRRDKPFIAINCGAIPDTLLESELFGYVKGAFSGADPNGRMGKFELANKGVIFLDEIGDMPLYLQVKLLRVLQERRVVRIGSNMQVDLDIRIIAATNKDMKKLIATNKFREDLYYRLNVIPMEIPSLREREGDVEIIMMKLIKKYSDIFGKQVFKIQPSVREILIDYPWPGNIRELENTVEFMINLIDSNGIITEDLLPASITEYYENKNKNYEDSKEEDIIPLKEIETMYINKALDRYGRDTVGKKLVAKKLGIGLATLYRKLGENI